MAWRALLKSDEEDQPTSLVQLDTFIRDNVVSRVVPGHKIGG